MIHDIDIILSISDSKISKISAAAHSKELNDVVAILNFENNITANLKVNRMDFKRSRKLHITTDNEHIDLDFLKRRMDIHRASAAKDLSLPTHHHDILGSKEALYFNGDSLQNELLYFLSCVEERKTPFTNAQTAALALETADHILAAL
jgi:predicted dehydrogenase